MATAWTANDGPLQLLEAYITQPGYGGTSGSPAYQQIKVQIDLVRYQKQQLAELSRYYQKVVGRMPLFQRRRFLDPQTGLVAEMHQRTVDLVALLKAGGSTQRITDFLLNEGIWVEASTKELKQILLPFLN